MMIHNRVFRETFTDYETTIQRCLSAADVGLLFDNNRPVMLKPNLVNDSPHPVTTAPAFCEAVIRFVRKHTQAPIVVAEGCGDTHLDTDEVFSQLGYVDLARRAEVELVDLNTAPLKRLTNDQLHIFSEIWLPEAVFEHTLISLPVLKAHSLCKFSGNLKNMIGLAPPEHYSGSGGSWKKAFFHSDLDEAITELNTYRSPDFAVMDASVGLADYHLGGPCCDPPVNLILAGFDSREVDRQAAALLNLDWRQIGHLI